MADNLDWTQIVIAEARQQSEMIPEAVWVQLEALLRGGLRERPALPPVLAKIAEYLIASMAPAPPKQD
jgi:hypothetical protein